MLDYFWLRFGNFWATPGHFHLTFGHFWHRYPLLAISGCFWLPCHFLWHFLDFRHLWDDLSVLVGCHHSQMDLPRGLTPPPKYPTSFLFSASELPLVPFRWILIYVNSQRIFPHGREMPNTQPFGHWAWLVVFRVNDCILAPAPWGGGVAKPLKWPGARRILSILKRFLPSFGSQEKGSYWLVWERMELNPFLRLEGWFFFKKNAWCQNGPEMDES